MLDKNLINVKNLLKIIISVLIIVSMCKSCVKAYSFNDYTEFLNYLIANNITNSGNSTTNYNNAITMTNNLINYASGHNLSNDNLTGIYYNPGSLYGMEIYFTYQNFTYYCQDRYAYQENPATLWYMYRKEYGAERLYTYTEKASGHGRASLYEGDPTNGDYYNCIMQNVWITTPPFEFTPYSIDEIDDYNIVKFAYTGNVALGALGDNTFYQLQVRLKDKNLNTIGTAYYDENGDNYYTDNALVIDGDIIKASTVYLYYTQPYILEFTIYSDSENYEINSYLYKFYPYSAVIENGVIVDSGDTTFNNQDQSIENQTFIQGLYNKMFTFSGDYIQEKLNQLKENNTFSSGDINLEKAFTDLINENNGDFKISWGNVYPNFTQNGEAITLQKALIPSGEVNFSKLERENQAFQEVMTWTRTLLGFSFGALLIKNLWHTTTQMLGIGYDIYRTDEDEKEIAKKGRKIMLLTFFIDLFTNLGDTILHIIRIATPQIDIAYYMIQYTTKIISICTQANNFMHFMLGDFVVVLIPLAIGLLLFKYTIYPIITFIRSIFVNSN